MSVFIVGQSALASFLKLLMLLIAFILILAASYYVTKWYAKSGFSVPFGYIIRSCQDQYESNQKHQ